MSLKSSLIKIATCIALIAATAGQTWSQNSMPAPGSGGSFTPNNGGGGPGGGGPGGGGAGGPGPIAPPPGSLGPNGWNSPWYGPNIIYQPVVYNSYTQGRAKVVGCGYDAMGIWRTIPMRVDYIYNGVQYSVTVTAAWDPWTNMWDTGLSVPAVNTSYYLNGTTYNFYVVLSTGTFYFNL